MTKLDNFNFVQVVFTVHATAVTYVQVTHFKNQNRIEFQHLLTIADIVSYNLPVKLTKSDFIVFFQY